jgi:hypothetical protein
VALDHKGLDARRDQRGAVGVVDHFAGSTQRFAQGLPLQRCDANAGGGKARRVPARRGIAVVIVLIIGPCVVGMIGGRTVIIVVRPRWRQVAWRLAGPHRRNR